VLEWEYAVESWSFIGADRDPWPGKDAWNALPDVPHYEQGTISGVLRPGPESPEAQQLRQGYYVWQNEQEHVWLNQMGDAQFELVAVYRAEDWGGAMFRSFPIIRVQCYVKRPRLPEEEPLPEKPQIGFQMDRER
jgi:hypothetical protein